MKSLLAGAATLAVCCAVSTAWAQQAESPRELRLVVGSQRQLQLAQPLLTLIWSVLLMGEQLPVAAPVVAVVVLGCILLTQQQRPGRAHPTGQAQ